MVDQLSPHAMAGSRRRVSSLRIVAFMLLLSAAPFTLSGLAMGDTSGSTVIITTHDTSESPIKFADQIEGRTSARPHQPAQANFKRLEVSRPAAPAISSRTASASVAGAQPATINTAAYDLFDKKSQHAQQAKFQPFPGEQEAVREEAEFDASIARNPCAAMPAKPYNEFGIGIAMPEGEFPVDEAAACWESLNQSAGPLVGMRFWGTTAFAWDATCLCYRPLYFEQVNLERYGYGCCECLQPACSAAHFFGTIPMLPYCMANDCPCYCNYSLGHYRPGDCVPRRRCRPPVNLRSMLAEGGIWTGMVFLIP